MLELDCGLEFDSGHDEIFFAGLPARPGVLMIEMRAAGAQPYLARTADIRRAAERLLREPEVASKRLNLRSVAAGVRYRVTGSKFEQTLALYTCARARFPKRYRDLLRLRPPAVLKVNLRNEYPRCYVTRRISGDGGFYFGPFASRKSAEAFAEGFLDLFKIRRCQIKIRRDPEFPGCIYSEMKMCLAPCFAGCTKEEYDLEVQRLVAFLETGGASLRETLAAERNQSSEHLDFEKAALLHKKLDKLDDALRGQPELARRLQDLNAVVLQRGVADQTIAVYQVRAGRIVEPFELSFASLPGDPHSAEQLLRRLLEPDQAAIRQSAAQSPAQSSAPQSAVPNAARNLFAPSPTPQTDLSEHLWLLARWFYSNPRQGEIFFRANAWPYRRMMRACARLLAPPEAKPGLPGQNKAVQQDNPAQSGKEREKNS